MIQSRASKLALPVRRGGHVLRSARREGGFTLLELLVVIAIIGILAAFLAMFVGGLTRKAKIEKTRALLNRLSVAAQSYKERYLIYPPSGVTPFSDGSRNLHWYLVAPQTVRTGIDPTNPANFTLEEAGPFLANLNNSEVRNGVANPWMAPNGNTALASQVIDTWGHAFGYFCAQQGAVYGGTNHYTAAHPDWLNNQGGFDLWSVGPMAPDMPGGDPPPAGAPAVNIGDQAGPNRGEEITNWSPRR